MMKRRSFRPWGIIPLEGRTMLSVSVAAVPKVTELAIALARQDIDRFFKRVEDQVSTSRANLLSGKITQTQFDQSTLKFLSETQKQILARTVAIPFGRKQLAPTLFGYLNDIYQFEKQGNALPAQLLHEGALSSIDDYVARGISEGRFTVAGSVPTIAGTWLLRQDAPTVYYIGTLRLNQQGSHVTGSVDWRGEFPPGKVSGQIDIKSQTLSFRVTYSTGSEPYGDYTAKISLNRREFQSGRAVSASGNQATWSAKLNG